MARGTVTPQLLVLNGGTAATVTAVDPTNGLQVISADGLWRRHFLQITSGNGTAGTVALVPGVYGSGPAFLGFRGTVAQQGTTYVTVPANGTVFIPVEGGQFVQADGLTVYLDFTPATMVGSVYAYELPANL